MAEITCRRTKWRRGDGTIEYAPGYYYMDKGPFTSREKAEEYKDSKDWAEKEDSGENRVEKLENEVADLKDLVDELRARIHELERNK